ncbi:Xaa-Pro aminopeptidase [Cronobacter malonaticus 681]|nr:Xaa-Pro aminopeptidase [Cronobacter malonaticus 681]
MLVLIKSDETHSHSVIFNRLRDKTAEIWFGRRLGQEAAPAKLGVDRALAFNEIDEQLYQLLNGLDVVYHAQGEYAYADTIVFTALDKLRRALARTSPRPPPSPTGGPGYTKCACLNRRKSWLLCAALVKSARWPTPARCRSAVRACMNTSSKAKFCMSSPATARAFRPTAPLWAAAKTAASCTTPKTKASYATAI